MPAIIATIRKFAPFVAMNTTKGIILCLQLQIMVQLKNIVIIIVLILAGFINAQSNRSYETNPDLY